VGIGRRLACPGVQASFIADAAGLGEAVAHHNALKAKYGIGISMVWAGGGDHGGGLDTQKIEDLGKKMAASPVRQGSREPTPSSAR